MSAAINFARKFNLIKEQWTPKVIAEMNDYQFKLVKIQGEFVWHSHADTDETFIVIDGELRIDLRDGAVTLAAGEMAVVPRGVEHRPHAEREACVLLIEPRGCAIPATRKGADRAKRCVDLGGNVVPAAMPWRAPVARPGVVRRWKSAGRSGQRRRAVLSVMKARRD